MRLETVSVIAVLAVASGIAYAWWVSRGRRRGGDLEHDAVAGRATVTAVTRQAGGAVRIAYRFRHPFTGASHDGAGVLADTAAVPEIGEGVDIAYLPDAPERSCLAAELSRRP